jgi:glucose/arabinose dehydrogenase/PKD repeat protein
MKVARTLLAIALLAVIAPSVPTRPSGAELPAGFTAVEILPDIKRATSFAYGPDGEIFVTEKNGVIRVYRNGVGSVYMNIKDQVNDFGSRGIVSMVLDPSWATNHHLYVLLTEELRPDDPDKPYPANGKIVRITSTASDPYVADLSTMTTLLTGYDHQSWAHGTDNLEFDPQGHLLASFGDGYNTTIDPRHFIAQDLDALNGKVIRIDPQTGAGVPGNPYYNAAAPNSVRSKIVAWGFRNPWRFSVDDLTGDVYVGDVGFATWEEVDVVHLPAANTAHDLNFGWPCYEGGNGVSLKQAGYSTDPDTVPFCNTLYSPSEGGTGIGTQAAAFAYNHSEPGGEVGSAITAGPRAAGLNYPPEYRDKVWLGDNANGGMRLFDPVTHAVTLFGASPDFGSPVDIKIAPSGNIAYLSIVEQKIYELIYNGSNTPPVAVAGADVTSGSAPLTVTFSSAGSYDPDPSDTLTFSWDFGDGSAPSSAPNPAHVYTAVGSYTATLTVSDGHPGSLDTDTVLVDVGNSPPVVAFDAPLPGTTYRIGDTIPIEISATDAEDGDLGGTSVTWDVILHHLGHIHPMQSGTGTTGSFFAADHDSDDTFLEFVATATDSLGRSTTVNEFLNPKKVSVTLTSDPAGAALVLDGQPMTAPVVLQSIVGGHHSLSTATTAVDATGTRAFDAWTSARLSSTTPAIDYFTPDGPLELAASYGPAIDGFSVGDVSVNEGKDRVRQVGFTISLPAPLATPASVSWATSTGSASSPSDFTAAGGTASFPAGAVSVVVTVPVKGDTMVEPDEQLNVTLSNPVGAAIADGFAVGRILDDEPNTAVTVSVGNVSIVEGDANKRNVGFTITLSGPPTGTVTVSWSTVAWTALSGSDFTMRSGTVNLSGNQRSKVVTVPVRGDGSIEPAEMFLVRLTSAVNASLGQAEGVGRITNDD